MLPVANKQKRQHKSTLRHLTAFSGLTVLALCALLLAACSSASTGIGIGGTTTPGATPSPTISQTLQDQGAMELQSFQQWIAMLKQYGGDTTSYQQQYTSDQQALANAHTSAAYNSALQTLQAHTKAIQIPALKQESSSLQQTLESQVSSWGDQHKYADSFDGKTYTLDYEYDNNVGIGGPLWLQEELNGNQTLADWQQTIEDEQMWLYNFQDFTKNAGDTTAANQVHQTDLDLMKHYGYTSGNVVVVSLYEQQLRAYTNGQLVQSFSVTTGQPDLPTPPGNWWVEGKNAPFTFKSSAPAGSADWYPDTPVNYAIPYHSNGYFLHDAWWRNDFGLNTNFAHYDSNPSTYSEHGSHGCVNMSKDSAAWVYNFVQLYTHVVIY
jgi:hypothetical protein